MRSPQFATASASGVLRVLSQQAPLQPAFGARHRLAPAEVGLGLLLVCGLLCLFGFLQALAGLVKLPGGGVVEAAGFGLRPEQFCVGILLGLGPELLSLLVGAVSGSRGCVLRRGQLALGTVLQFLRQVPGPALRVFGLLAGALCRHEEVIGLILGLGDGPFGLLAGFGLKGCRLLPGGCQQEFGFASGGRGCLFGLAPGRAEAVLSR